MADTRALTDIIERVSDGIIISDVEGVVTYVNEAVVRITGGGKDDWIGRHLDRLDSKLKDMPLLHILLERGYWEGELTIHRNDDTRCQIGLLLSLLKDRRGEPLGIMGTVRDLTEKKNLEQKLREAEAKYLHIVEKDIREKKQLEDELIQYYNAFKNSSHGIIITDLKGNIIDVNDGFVKIFGYGHNEIIGKTTAILRSRHSSDDLYKQMWESLEKHNGWRGEIINRRKDGSEVPILLSITSIFNSSNEKIGYMGVEIDLTERKRLEQQITHSEKLATIGQLAAGIAHEIGTPLNVISGNAEYLLMDLKKQDKGYEELQVIIAQTNRIAKLIQQLLDFARPKKLSLKLVNLNDEIRNVLTLVQYHVDKHQIKVTKTLSNDLPLIYGDSGQLQQVFLNVIMNALQAMDDGGKLTITTEPSSDIGSIFSGKSVIVKVSDTGCGIPQENLRKIFDPFFTTKEVGKGTGLGLAVAQRIVYEHKGTIEVESKVNYGTTFTVRFPVHSEKGRET